MNVDLLVHNVKLSLRQFKKAPAFSFVQTVGSAMGLVVALIIFLYARFELSYDKFHPGAESTYRVNLNVEKDGNTVSQSARTTPAFAGRLKNFPEVEAVSRVVLLGEVIVGNERVHIREQNVLLTDSEHFQLFHYSILKGDEKKALAEPLSVMLSQTVAAKLFGDADPIGKTIEINSSNFDGTETFQVTAVFENEQTNTHLKPEILISYSTLYHFIGDRIDQSWDWHNLYTYVHLNKQADIGAVEGKFDEILRSEYGESLDKKQEQWNITLQPISAIHRTTLYTGEFEPGVSFINIQLLSAIGIFIVVILLANSINLTLSKSLRRAKEVGVRKVSGAFRFQLILQFLSESLLIHVMSAMVACVAIILFYPYISDYLGIQLMVDGKLMYHLLVPAISYIMLATLLSGFYPAVILSSHHPSKALRGIGEKVKAGFGIRKSLIAAQFVISIAAIVGTLAVSQQLKFMNSSDLGIDIKDKLVIRAPKVQEEGSDIHAEAFKNQLSMIPAINGVAGMNEVPGSEVYWKSDSYQRKGATSSAVISWLTVDDHYFDLLRMPLAQGRPFNKRTDTYQSSVVLNETAVQAFGFDHAQQAIGGILEVGGQEIRIVGVVSDFHQEGLQKKIEPTVFRFSANTLNYFVVDIPLNDSHALSQVEEVFVRNFPDSPYEYFFLDEHFNKQYQSEKLLGKIGFSLTIFSLVLAAVGLAGLSLQTISQRSKEIGIRKVMGANVRSLLVLLSKEYFVVLVVSAVISLPVSFVMTESWLNHFAFKADIGVSFFVIPLLVVFVIMSLSIGWQTLKATLVNPVSSLKYE